jgi:EAL domain-containing protein (putative c-di-GMP-specific phosphodiesterase class I)
MKVGPLLVEAHHPRLDGSGTVIELTSIDDLAKLADRKNSMILHEARGASHYYLVQGDGATYRYVLNGHDEGLMEISPLSAEEELRCGFERGEFQVYYQPIVSLRDQKIIAVEALLRWQHPQRGLVAARDFIPTVKAAGMIEPIGEWMLQASCEQLKKWQDAGACLELSVNFAEGQLESDPVNVLSRVLRKTGIDPHTLQLEIPEQGIIHGADKLLSKIQELKRLGVQISVDNFEGQMSFSSVGQYPISSVKIDRVVVQGVGAENTRTLDDMAASARSAGLNVIAVGVETEAQLEHLPTQYCSQAQGLLLGGPAPAGEITLRLLKSMQPGPRSAGRRKKEYR